MVHPFPLADDEALDAWTQRWDALAHRSGALVFSSPAWVGSWRAVMEPEARLVLLVDGPVDDPSGLLPLARLRQRLHPRLAVTVPYWGIAGSGLGAADHLGPVAVDPAAIDRLVDASPQVAGRGVALVLANVAPAAQAAAAGLARSTPVAVTTVSGMSLEGVERAEALWSKKLAGNLRRARRLLAEDGYGTTWHRLGRDDHARLAEHGRLHALRWSAVGRPGLFDERRQRFLAELAGRLRAPDGVWQVLVEREGSAIGSGIVLRYGGTVCTYSTGRDPAAGDRSIGPGLHEAAIRWALEAGATRYEFLRGVEEHKRRLGGQPSEDVTYVVGRSPAAELLRFRAALQRRRDAR